MVTQQILVLSFWVRVPAAQHTKAPFSGVFVVFLRVTLVVLLFQFCLKTLSIDNKAGVSAFADGFVAFVSSNGKGETATIYGCQNGCGSDCCAEG